MPTPKITWRVEHHNVLPSTNTLARELAQRMLAHSPQNLPTLHGLAIRADIQTAGRGQYHRKWKSPAGNLYLTALVTELAEPAGTLLPLIAGVAVLKTLKEKGFFDALLRWPNDVVLGNKKIAGILCEALATATDMVWIIGMGVNVNQQVGLSTATSMLELDGKVRNLEAFTHDLLEALAEQLWRVQEMGPEEVLTAAQKHDSLAGHFLTVLVGDELWSGQACGIHRCGGLKLRTKEGEKVVKFGSISTIDGVLVRATECDA